MGAQCFGIALNLGECGLCLPWRHRRCLTVSTCLFHRGNHMKERRLYASLAKMTAHIH
jgi:hypothetical protein